MRTVIADLGHDSMKPLTYTRSSTDIEVGGSTLFEHIERGLNSSELSVLVPEYLEEITERNTELYDLEREVNSIPESEFLLYNSTVVPNEVIRSGVEDLESGEGLYYEDTFIAGVTDRYPNFEDIEEFVEEFERTEIDEEPVILEYPWDIVEHNGDLIRDSFPGEEVKGEINPEAEIIGDGGLYIGEDAEIDANATIDTSEGPVYIGSGTRVWPNSRIEGPVYIGIDTKVGAGENAVIHENTHIGDVARAGGEFEDAVMSSFTNKYHYGFLGHAVVGSWVNFGAGTTNSDLKNTYGDVTVEHPVEGSTDAGLKVGASIADHTKTDIQTGIYTGKQIGPVAKIAGKVTSNVNPFTWQNPGSEDDYIPEKATTHAERMMDRREDYLPNGYIKAQKNLIRELSSRE
ncbi:putative sugar nucleotidyl transferase [Candidatus Nanosalina sp. VS9-1]|uniref:putative sugar nucleotidyl transferase n=1 Tax=Candidatus Nanosalina sp. VS9-1 TaxID=3388566 RepID=UPI0039E0C7C5